MIAARTAKAAVLFLLAAVAIQIQPAWAHGGPIGACPAPFDVVSQLENIEITFSEPIDETGARTISLFADEGRSEIELGPTTLADPTTLVAAIPASLEPGMRSRSMGNRTTAGTRSPTTQLPRNRATVPMRMAAPA